MPVFKPRNRLVNFRLSEEEFDKLRASCALYGARSLSDFARSAVMRSVVYGLPCGEAVEETSEKRLAQMEGKVQDLETRLDELVKLLASLRESDASAPSSAVSAVKEGVAE